MKIKKEENDAVKMCDNGKAITLAQKKKIVTYKLKFIDSSRFMQDSLSNLADNLSKIDKKISHAALIEKFYNASRMQ